MNLAEVFMAHINSNEYYNDQSTLGIAKQQQQLEQQCNSTSSKNSSKTDGPFS
jgi:hypothetical protein